MPEGQINQLLEMFPPDRFDTSKLHPDLKPYVVEHEEWGIQLKHPLVYQVLGFSYAMANKMYEAKSRHQQEYMAEGNFSMALWLFERPWRIEMLKRWYDDNFISLEQMRKLLPEVWTDTEIPQGNQDDPMYLFREAGFVTDDQEGFDKLRPVLTLYRGVDYVCELTHDGPSWTLDRNTAIFFGKRYADGDVFKVRIPKEAALAYFIGRDEAEIILDFDNPQWSSYRDEIITVGKAGRMRRSSRSHLANKIRQEEDSK
jgi:hypothetical protein